MSGLITIELKSLRFFAFHGLYQEEKIIGNEFEVNLTVAHVSKKATIADLDDTINYAGLYSMLQTEMQKPRELLETFAMELAEGIHVAFPLVKKIDIAITKLHPPIPRFTGTVTVSYSREF